MKILNKKAKASYIKNQNLYIDDDNDEIDNKKYDEVGEIYEKENTRNINRK